ncbi:hypothetical protein GCM10007036_21710 [Alsobacter metallidurans]|uniref:DUF2147 domain-containing protein n=1 Tax=Alsobacter metallidurans TaxID=340221 RepID=A0A917I7R1_9HYPH|nr:hypothetical protein GCM10007036_21710 [Alsobacter metallidurans]
MQNTARTLHRALFCAGLLAATLSAGPTRAAPPDPIVGVWEQVDEDGDVGALIALKERGGTIEGVIVKLFPAPGEPPNPVCSACLGALHNAPLLGLTVVDGLRRTKERYEGGSILDPDTGETYQLTAVLAAGNRSLQVHAYRGVSLLGRTQQWRRAANQPRS